MKTSHFLRAGATVCLVFVLSGQAMAADATAPALACTNGRGIAEHGPAGGDALASSVIGKVNKVCADYTADLTTPDAPALAVLDGGVAKSTSAANIQEFTASVLSATQTGSIQPGLAATYAPFYRYASRKVSQTLTEDTPLSTWGGKWYEAALGMTEVSVASTKVSAQSDAVRVALGVRIPLYSEQPNPLFNQRFFECSLAVLNRDADSLRKAVLDDIAPSERKKNPELAREYDDIQKRRLKKVEACDAVEVQSAALKWNSSSVSLGLGKGWISKDGKANKLDSERSAVWLSGGFGIETHSKLEAHVQHSSKAVEVDELTGTRTRADRTIVGFRYRFAPFNDRIRFGIEQTLDRGSDDSRLGTKLLSIEAKVGKDLWLVGATGTRTGRDGDGKTVFTTSLKWGFTE